MPDNETEVTHPSKNTKRLPILKKQPVRHIMIASGGFLLLFIGLAGVAFFRKPVNKSLYDAPGPIVFQKLQQESLHTDPSPDAPPPNYEPATFQLFDNGNIVCAEDHADSGHSHDDVTASAFSLKSGKLTKKQQDSFVSSIKEAGFEGISNSPVTSGNADTFAHETGFTTYNMVNNGRAKTAIYMNEEGLNKPAQLKAVDSLIESTCKSYAKAPLTPGLVELTMHVVRDSKSIKVLPEVTQADMTAASSNVGKQLGELIAQNDKFPISVLQYQGQDKEQLLAKVFKDKTSVRLTTTKGPVVLTYQPSMPTTGDINTQIEKLHAHQINSLSGLQNRYYNAKKVGMQSGAYINRLADLITPKAEAVTQNARRIRVTYLQFDDVPHDVTKSQMESAAGAVANWYKIELAIRDTNNIQNFGFEGQIYPMSNGGAYLTSCNGLKGRVTCERLRDSSPVASIGYNLEHIFGLPRDPDVIDVYVLDQRIPEINDIVKSKDMCGWSSAPSSYSVVVWQNDQPGSCAARSVLNGQDDFTLGKNIAHEVGHAYGLVHTHEVTDPNNPAREPVHPQYGEDIMNYLTMGKLPFPANVSVPLSHAEVANLAPYIHLSPIQREFILGYFGADFGQIAASGAYSAVSSRTPQPSVIPQLPPPPPAKDPHRGEDDGHWSVWTSNNHYYTNPALPGRCVYKASNGTFAVGVAGADYDCVQLAQMYKCQNEFAKLDPTKPETFANASISPECGNQGTIRAAGQLAAAFKLSQTVPKGSLDGRNSDCTIQGGWAYSEANKNVPIDVHLYYDGPAGVGTGYQVKTDVQRNDLKGFGNNGIHGFEFQIPDKYKDNKPHTVYMYAIGIMTNGWKNNKNPLVGQTTFRCDYPPQGNVEVVNAKMVNGTFECKVQGWAYDRTDGNQALQVHAYIDGFPGTGRSAGAVISTANIYRADLQNAGQGNGKHGFYFDIPQQFRDANKHKLRVYALGVYPFNVPDGTHPLIGEMDFQCDDHIPDGVLEQVIVRSQGAAKECVVAGWSADLSASIYSNNVALYFDLSPDGKNYGLKVDSYLADLNRPDVRAAGWGWGNSGNHGFEYKIPANVYHDGKPHTVNAYSLNIDWFGSYMKQNNRFIGKKTFTCPK